MHQDQSSNDAPPKRRTALLPALIFLACGLYFGGRFWESGEHIFGLLAGINAVGLFITLAGHRR
jgi:hypothetical protein